MIVPDDQLSLAIGRDGQNARLAARLTGWRVDIKSETEFSQEDQDVEYEGEEQSDGRCMAVLSNGRRCPNAAIDGSTDRGLPGHQALSTFRDQPGGDPLVPRRSRDRDPRRSQRRRRPDLRDRPPRPRPSSWKKSVEEVSVRGGGGGKKRFEEEAPVAEEAEQA